MNYFCYVINPFSGYPIVQINKHIGYDDEDGYGIDGCILSRELFELDSFDGTKFLWDDNGNRITPKKPELITIYVNSLGGDVSQGFDILNALLSIKARTKVIIQGFAYSTMGWAFLPATEIVIYDYSSWMCHLPYNPDDPTQKSEFLDTVSLQIATILAGRSGRGGKDKKTLEEVQALMKAKTYYSGQRMADEGFADECLKTSVVVDKSSNVKNLHKVFNKINSKDTNTNHNQKVVMDKVINKLGLVSGSGEDSILAGIARIENDISASNKDNEKLKVTNKELSDKLEAVNKEKKDLETKLTEAETKNEEMVTAFDKMKATNETIEAENKDLKTKVDAAENKEKEAVDAANLLKAKNLVAKFYNAGKIRHEDVAKWEKRAATNFEDTELILEGMPTNMHVPKPMKAEDGAENKAGELPQPGSFEYYIEKNKIKNKERMEKWEKDVAKFWEGKIG